MLHVHKSNRIEALAAWLAADLQSAGRDPILPDRVAVPSAGMERWLALALAQHLGVCANVLMPFPAAQIREIVRAVLPEAPMQDGPWSVEGLAMRLIAILRRGAHPVLAQIAPAGSAEAPVHRAEWAFARELADLFDRYGTFRPDMLEAWERGERSIPALLGAPPAEVDWQAALWLALRAESVPPPPWRTLADAIARLREPAPVADLPLRLDWFGLTSLPPVWLSLLEALGRHTTVKLWLWAPSAELGEGGKSAAGHPLAAANGRVHRDFQSVLYGSERDLVEPDALLIAPDLAGESRPSGAPPSALARLQADLLHDRPPPEPEARTVLAVTDLSLQLHACHGPVRQVEVLRDALLRLIDTSPPERRLEPRDILVLCPDIEVWGPIFSAIFGVSHGDHVRLPLQIADRQAARTNPLAEPLLAVLRLAGGRAPLSSLLDLLDHAPVARRFALSEHDLERAREGLVRAGARRGLDATDHAALGLPDDTHSWAWALDRLLLGACLPAGGSVSWEEMAPLEVSEGQDAAWLGRLSEAVETVTRLARALEAPRPWRAWESALREASRALCELEPEAAWRVRELHRALSELGARLDASELDIGRDTALQLVDGALTAARGGASLVTGAVTLAAMVPMRNIPARVIALVGLDDSTFPRGSVRPRADLIAAHRRAGDRDRRDEDRAIFLESLAAARDAVVLTWTGRDPRSNTVLPPSVPVAELLDWADASWVGAEGQAARALLVREHPVAAFSPRSYAPDRDGRGPWSHDPDLSPAARAALTLGDPCFWPAELRVDSPPPADLADLVRRVTRPVQSLLERTHGLYFHESGGEPPDTFPFEADPLERWAFRDALLRSLRSGVSAEVALAHLRASGALSMGAFGEVDAASLEPLIVALLGAAQATLGDRVEQRVEAELIVGGQPLPFVLHTHGDLRLDLRAGSLRPPHLLSAWLEHLALAAAGAPVVTHLFSVKDNRPKHTQLESLPAEEALALLQRAWELAGACGQRPCPCDAEVLAALATHVPDEGAPLRGPGLATAALGAWRSPRPGYEGLEDKAWNQVAFRGIEPFADLADLARPEPAWLAPALELWLRLDAAQESP